MVFYFSHYCWYTIRNSLSPVLWPFLSFCLYDYRAAPSLKEKKKHNEKKREMARLKGVVSRVKEVSHCKSQSTNLVKTRKDDVVQEWYMFEPLWKLNRPQRFCGIKYLFEKFVLVQSRAMTILCPAILFSRHSVFKGQGVFLYSLWEVMLNLFSFI